MGFLTNGSLSQNNGNNVPQTPLIDPRTNLVTPAWGQYFINLLNYTSADSATSGYGVLPERPVGFINVTVQGKQFKVPYYNQ